MKIQLLLTGNEIMSGHTVDSNSALISEKLLAAGYTTYRKTTIGDDLNLLTSEIINISENSDILIINGGLGPTVDDLTAQALSLATQSPLAINNQALSHVKLWCEKRQYAFNNSSKKQAIIPVACHIIDNPAGSAVGFYCHTNNCLIICTPGVPSELRRMLDESIVNLIEQYFPERQPPSTLRLQTFGIGESTLQEIVNTEYPDWPPSVALGFRAGIPQLEIKLTIEHIEHLSLQQHCLNWLKQRIGDYIIGANDTQLAASLIDILRTKNQRLCTAESCTGGKIASMITEIAGSSSAFEAALVTYSNASKQRLLNVESTLLEEHGAVSEAVVRAMAQGAIKHTACDYAIAVSGIAGPEGGTTDKPVGTVCIAWGGVNSLKTLTLYYPFPRKNFQLMVAAMSIDLLRRDLLNISTTPYYLERYKKNDKTNA